MDKETILKTSENHFFAKKYTDVKLDNIANDLGIRKPSLYYYFTDKKDLYIQTLKYSINRYINDFKEIISKNDIDEFLHWYIMYPSDTKNLFAIAYQKGYIMDKMINAIIFNGKNTVNALLYRFLESFTDNKVKSYLILNLMEKLAQDNCIDGYCLLYDIDKVKQEIKMLIESPIKELKD